MVTACLNLYRPVNYPGTAKDTEKVRNGVEYVNSNNPSWKIDKGIRYKGNSRKRGPHPTNYSVNLGRQIINAQIFVYKMHNENNNRLQRFLVRYLFLSP